MRRRRDPVQIAVAHVDRAFTLPDDDASDDAWEAYAVADELTAAVAGGWTGRDLRQGAAVSATEAVATLRRLWGALDVEQQSAVDELADLLAIGGPRA